MSLIHIILIFALSGAIFSLYKTQKNMPHREPFDDDPANRHPVAHIKKVLFLEVPIERIAAGYFAILLLAYVWLWVTSTSMPELELGLLMFSGIVFLLLFFKQVLVTGIADHFRWRVLLMLLLSAFLTLLIWHRPDVVTQPLLETAKVFTLTLHLLGLVLGLGGAFILDVMIFHFLNNLKISSREAVIMHLISQMIIFGLILLIVSGVALTLTDPGTYLENPRFQMKMTGVFVVILNGILLNLFIVPEMEKISFREGEMEKNSGLIRFAFVTGAVSMVSWFSVFILAMINPLEKFSYPLLPGVYLLLLAGTIARGLATKKIYEKNAE